MAHVLLQVANLARNFTTTAPIPDLKDGGWHMLTLTSQPDGGLGYRMYVDGILAGQMQTNQTYMGELCVFIPQEAHSVPIAARALLLQRQWLLGQYWVMPALLTCSASEGWHQRTEI